MYRDWSIEKKLERDRELFKELAEYYDLITKLVLICLKRDLRIIIENPKSATHILSDYWAIKPKVVDKDRSRKGDYYKKPTQYWFINCEPKHNFIFSAPNYKNKKRENISYNTTVNRSMIHPDYANRFIREYILESEVMPNDKKVTNP